MTLGLDFLKIKSLYSSKHTIGKVEGAAPKWEKIFAICMLVISRIY